MNHFGKQAVIEHHIAVNGRLVKSDAVFQIGIDLPGFRVFFGPFGEFGIGEIVTVLNTFLPESYDREVFLHKSSIVFNHIVDQAMTGYNWVA